MKLPRRPLTDVDLSKYVKELNISNFRGIFMRNDLPKSKPWTNECAIVNLDNKDGSGMHCERIHEKKKEYTLF